ncbi:hypothetical protein E4U51_001883 [Claviceps purpurea]|nr:hypothetical protein E4U51_001883 [Claviceps purpurea]
MTVTFYNKTDSQRDSPKIIPRFLPWRAGQLLSSYLVYIQPLAALMGDGIGLGSCQSEYVWAHKPGSADNPVPWPTRMLTDIVNTRSGKDLGEVFGTLDYRHIGIGIGRKYVGQHFAKDCFTDEMDDVEGGRNRNRGLAGNVGRQRYCNGRHTSKGRPATEPEAPRARNVGNSGEEDEVRLDRLADHADHHSHHSHQLQYSPRLPLKTVPMVRDAELWFKEHPSGSKRICDRNYNYYQGSNVR